MEYRIEQRDIIINIDSIGLATVQDFFDAYIASKKIQHLMIQNKEITIDGQNVQRNTALKGKELRFCLYPYEYPYTHSCHNKLEIIYEDELFLVVNKPSGIIVHSDGNNKETLSDMVSTYYYDQHKNYYSAQALHRLDEDTSGMVVFSKSVIFQPLLDQMLANKQIRRHYLAFVEGKIAAHTRMMIENPLGKDRHDSRRVIVYAKGQKAQTKVESLGYGKKNYSVLSCRLLTGRTHQIRVHLSHNKMPILNDKLYGNKSDLMKDMGLIANELHFYHPLKGEMMALKCPLTGDFKRLYEGIIDEEDC